MAQGLRITLKQGDVTEEFVVPEGTLISGFGAVVKDGPHAPKFTLSESTFSGSSDTVLDIDGTEYPWCDLLPLAETPLSTIVGDAEHCVLILPTAPPVAVVLLPVVSALEDSLEPLGVHEGVPTDESEHTDQSPRHS